MMALLRMIGQVPKSIVFSSSLYATNVKWSLLLFELIVCIFKHFTYHQSVRT